MEEPWTCDTLDCMTEDDRGDAEDESGAEDEGEPGSPALPAIAGAAASAGYRCGGLPGALVAGGAVPYAAALLRQLGSEWRADRARRVEKMMEAAGGVTGLGPEQLADLAGHSTTRLVHASCHRGLQARQRRNPAQPACTPIRLA
jgi:hypothetical protein